MGESLYLSAISAHDLLDANSWQRGGSGSLEQIAILAAACRKRSRPTALLSSVLYGAQSGLSWRDLRLQIKSMTAATAPVVSAAVWPERAQRRPMAKPSREA
jgi:hypothetical protein